MKTKVRVIKTIGSYRAEYTVVQLLEHPYKGSLTIESYGFINFRKFDGSNDYIFVDFKIETTNYKHILKLGKLAKYIRENTNHDSPIEEVLEKIGAEIYDIQFDEFVSENDRGKFMYKVTYEDINGDEVLYTKIIAKNDRQAEFKVEKMNLLDHKATRLGEL